jgi:hypothetical protein
VEKALKLAQPDLDMLVLEQQLQEPLQKQSDSFDSLGSI